MSIFDNPFPPGDPDRSYLWNMLVQRDIDAFLARDWSLVADDFVGEGFWGIDGRFLGNPDSWRLTFPSLDAYRQSWLTQAQDFAKLSFRENPRERIFAATTLRDMEVVGDSALLHKKFDGSITQSDGQIMRMNWQTLYVCRRVLGTWKISGFVGYLPHPLSGGTCPQTAGKNLPQGATQHVTAGPYSPVLTVGPGQLVVLSGQAPVNREGSVVGNTIEEQAKHTLANCRAQLACAGVDFRNVFKVNVFLADLAHWPRFNEVYRREFPEPFPVRTAVQAGLLNKFLVEIEMWAIKP